METLVELIAKKRDGGTLTGAQVERLITSLGAGDLADYQMSAFLMAVFFRGMDDAETVALTKAMLHSGDVLDLSAIAGKKVDKHSTGGVGDKVSICLAPLVAACGVRVPMVSGRGLGHTGGTLDKLEAIPGFSVRLSAEAFARAVEDVGTAMIGQTERIAPADRKIYALRDVTATVESIPLIVASILSKKLAEGIDALVLDVKVGRGAFMKDLDRARALARALVNVGTGAGKSVVALLTQMDSPLGLAIGNANETREAIEVLHGGGPPDTVECTIALGAEMLVQGGVASSVADGRARIEKAIGDGSGARTFERMIETQGGDPSVVGTPSKLAIAPVEQVVTAREGGFVHRVDALELGLSAVSMGAGRTRADQPVDHAVGIDLCVTIGDRVEPGAPLARLRLRKEDDALAARVGSAFGVGAEKVAPGPLVLDRMEASS